MANFKIRLYVVGIHFNKEFDLAPDLDEHGYRDGDKDSHGNPVVVGPKVFVSGKAILEAAAKVGLRYQLSVKPLSPIEGHINYVSYTPQVGDKVRTTFGRFGAAFPYYGLPLSLDETLVPIGQPSRVIQYTIQDGNFTDEHGHPLPPPRTRISTGPGKDGDSSFGTNGFSDNTEIRIRSLNIYTTY